MCIICVDFQKQLLTASEARRNAREMIDDLGHLYELEALIKESDA